MTGGSSWAGAAPTTQPIGGTGGRGSATSGTSGVPGASAGSTATFGTEKSTLHAHVSAQLWEREQFVLAHGEAALSTMLCPGMVHGGGVGVGALSGRERKNEDSISLTGEADEWAPSPLFPDSGVDELWRRNEASQSRNGNGKSDAGAAAAAAAAAAASSHESLTATVLRELVEEVVQEPAVRRTCTSLPQAPVPYFGQLGTGAATESKSDDAAADAKLNDKRPSRTATGTGLAWIETKGGNLPLQSAEATLRRAEPQELAARVLENSIFNLVRDAIDSDFSLTESPKRIVRIQ